MAQLYTTGPCHIFLTNATGTTPLYLGTAESSPHVELVPMYEDVFNSVGGKVPFDKSYQGEVAVTNVDINRLNMSTYLSLASRPRSPLVVGAGPVLGANAGGDVGSLVLTEGLQMGLVLQFSFGPGNPLAKAAMAAAANGALPSGYFFPASVPIGPDKLDPLGTIPEKINLTFLSLRVYNPTAQSFTLYSTTLPAGLVIS